jgi:hypothetical protein
VSGRDPYRRPAPAPVSASKRARAVATRPESPEERDQREAQELAESRKKHFRAETALASEELGRARLAFGIGMRLAGAAMFVLTLLSIGAHASSIAGGATSIWVGRIGPVGLFLGPYLVVVGAGGAADKHSTPMWWRIGAIGAFLAGLAAGGSFEVDLAIFVADAFY